MMRGMLRILVTNLKKWNEIFQSYEKQNPEKAKEFLRRVNKEEPDGFQKLSNEIVKEVNDKSENLATRKSSQNALNLFAPLFPELIGVQQIYQPQILLSIQIQKIF